MTGTEEARRRASRGRPAPAAIELRRGATPDTVAEFRHAAEDFARGHGINGAGAENVKLAVSEAVTNAVKYAYEPEEDGAVSLTASAEDGWLEVRVSDEGHGFRAGMSGGLGLGLSIIAQVCAELTIHQGERGTELRMRFLGRASE
jgi:anti-sigma regulatory factor (Ser/Thr protein kinase)